MKRYKQGWYKIQNPEKFILPIDEHMQSYKNGFINYKSSLELKAFRFVDKNHNVKKFSVEPFPIKYLKPTDGKFHRYYIDLFIEFITGEKFLVEIKPKSQTTKPNPPKNKSDKSMHWHKNALLTFDINKAKWKAAKEFASHNGFKFIILTDKDMGL